MPQQRDVDDRQQDDTITDGRRQRSQRSRAAIVDALLDLLGDGEVAPSSTRIAERAGVTQRTLFNHFADMDALISAATARQLERVLQLAPSPIEAPFDRRLDDFVARLSEVLERTMNVRWAVLVNDVGSRSGVDIVRSAHDLVRSTTMACFADEFSRMTRTQRDVTLATVDLVGDPAAWYLRRTTHGQSVETARRSHAQVLRAALEPFVDPAEGLA